MAPHSTKPEAQWTTAAERSYSTNVARTSTLAASALIELTSKLSPVTGDSRVIDVGAGTGALTLTLTLATTAASQSASANNNDCESSPSPSTAPAVTAVDISEGMLSTISAKGLPNVTVQQADARDLVQALLPPPPSSTGVGTETEAGAGAGSLFTHAFNLFMLQTVPNPSRVLDQMYSILAPGHGIASIALWARRNGPFEIWEAAAQKCDPDYILPPPFDDPHAWRTTEELQCALTEAGFVDVECVEEEFAFPFESAAHFAGFWFAGRNPAALVRMDAFPGGRAQAEVKVRGVMEEIVRDSWADGREIKTWAVLGIGRKP